MGFNFYEEQADPESESHGCILFEKLCIFIVYACNAVMLNNIDKINSAGLPVRCV